MTRRLSFTEKRRARLALKANPDRLESKRTITEPINVMGLATSALRGLAQIGIMQAGSLSGAVGGVARPSHAVLQRPSPALQALLAGINSIPITAPVQDFPVGAGGSGAVENPAAPSNAPIHGQTDNSLAPLTGTSGSSSQSISLSAPWVPASSATGGGALPPRGGSGGPSTALVAAATPGRGASAKTAAGTPAASSSSGAAGALLATLGLGAGSKPAAPAAALPPSSVSRNALARTLNGGADNTPPRPGITPDTSLAFELETLDFNDGSVMVPGFEQLATPGGSVDLRAQVRDSATGTYTYSWSTSGLTSANSISGASTYDLTFGWNTSISTASAESVTLTVTDPNLNQVSQTYTFWVPAGTGTAAGGTTWNNSTLDPGLLQASAPAFASQNVSVVEDTGALETSINLPSYNPNIGGLTLNYDSLAANAMPIIVAEHPLDPSQAVPSQVSAQLTFNGSAGTTYYYSTSGLQPGDIMQIGLQASATTLSTGVYSYTETIIDYRGSTPTTFTYTGNATVENAAEDPTFSALGAGWTVGGLEKIIPATGGVILDDGDGTVEWFSGSFGSGGGTYTSPAGDFSTLVLNSSGTYTRTLTDGTQQNFNSSGLETTSIDRNGLTTTFGYSSSLLQTITDPFGGIVTFTYNGSNQLQSIKDPAGRLATFTLSSGDLTAVEYPDTSTWDYGYDSSGRMTSVTEPSSTGEPTKITTITYDSAERVGTITRADGTTEEYSPAQVQGWTDSGTTGSPAPSVLLAEVGSTYTDPLNNVTTDSPDWRGMGLTDQETDALGNVSTTDRSASGLATITVDPLNRITQYAYDSHGNVTEEIYPDLSTTTDGTYNSFAEPASMTDQLGRITTYTYDSHGNMTVKEDALTNVTTYTYSSTQPGMLTAQTAPAPAGSSSYTLFSYQYDSQDRQTTVTNADSDVTVTAYSSAGQVISVKDPNSNVTTYSYDAMNRETGTTDAAGSAIAGVSTFTFDKAGNQVTSADPDNDTTTTTYDALDRQSTVETPDGGITTYSYDNDGRLQVLIDPVGNRTTYAYDSLGRQTTVTSPSVNSSTGVISSTEYDADGEVIETTDADGRQITYSYDQLGRQTGESWLNSGGSAIYIATFTYDADGEMTGAADANATLTIAYDNGGRLGTIVTSGPETGQPTVTLTYSYDPSGDVTSITDSLSGSGASGQGITSYVYDNALRLGTITQSLGGTAVAEVQNSYDSGGRLTHEDRTVSGGGTSVNTEISYDAANNVTFMDDYVPPTGHVPGLGGTFDINNYKPDPAGLVTSMTYNDSNSTNTYSYDPSAQLTASGDSQVYAYSYDLNGNRTSTGYTTGAGNELTNSPGATYTYDNDGNMISQTTSAGTTTYTYDYENRMTGVDQYGTAIATYTYNALGQRVGIKDGGTQIWTVYNGKSADANPYADFNSSGSVTMRYLDGQAVDEILAQTSSSGVTAWYITDKLGTVEDIVSTSGTVEDHILYDSFGNVTSQTNSTYAVRFMFAGMEYDSTTGLYYDHAQYYDSITGRFVSQDPMGFKAGDTDLYRYVENAPTNAIDQSGLDQAIKRKPWLLNDLDHLPGVGNLPNIPNVPNVWPFDGPQPIFMPPFAPPPSRRPPPAPNPGPPLEGPIDKPDKPTVPGIDLPNHPPRVLYT